MKRCARRNYEEKIRGELGKKMVSLAAERGLGSRTFVFKHLFLGFLQWCIYGDDSPSAFSSVPFGKSIALVYEGW